MTNEELGRISDVLLDLCAGNPGAIMAMVALLEHRQEHIIYRFKALNIRGPRIYLLCSAKDGGIDLRKLSSTDVTEASALVEMLDEIERGGFPARMERSRHEWDRCG